MPTSTPTPSEPSAPAEPTPVREGEAESQTQDAEPDLLGDNAEAPESLYAIRRRRLPRWIPDGS
jgi:hypothetical protein